MPHSIIKKIISDIENNFSSFEEYLKEPIKIDHFKSFLSEYRGLPVSEFQKTYKHEQIAHDTAENIVNFFGNILLKNKIADLNENEIQNILTNIEKIVNLTLYYWTGLNDRNYQFRTLIHFFELEGYSLNFLTKNNSNFSISLSENGIRFGLTNSNHDPKLMPVSKVCGLHCFNQFSSEREIFPRIRTIQREICLLIDDWEHLNSILALEYGKAYQELQQNQNTQNELAFEKISLKMNSRRDTLAEWCLESFCDFQEWITEFIGYNNFSEDIQSELYATSGLILSAIQKIFLPASVSRHRYCTLIPPLLERFAKSRIKLNNEDIASHLLLQVSQSSLGLDFDISLLNFIDKKPFEWTLSFDPSSAIKAFSWSYSKEHHLLLCLIYAICFFRKIAPNFIELQHLSDIATTIQMPETFPSDLSNKTIHQNKSNVSINEFQRLFGILNNYLKSNVKSTKQTEELSKFICSNLQLSKVF